MAGLFEKITEAFKSNDDVNVDEAIKAAADAGVILAAVGGKENVKAVNSCATRLRLTLADTSVVDANACKSAGAIGVLFPEEGMVHVVLGTEKVQNIRDAFEKLL